MASATALRPYFDYQYPYFDYQYPYFDYHYPYFDYHYPYFDYQYPYFDYHYPYFEDRRRSSVASARPRGRRMCAPVGLCSAKATHCVVRWSLPHPARRYTCGILEGNLLPPAPPKREWRELMEDLSAISCECVRNVLHDVATWHATVQHAAFFCNTLCCEPMANATAISHEYRHTHRRAGMRRVLLRSLTHGDDGRNCGQRPSHQESILLHCRNAMRCRHYRSTLGNDKGVSLFVQCALAHCLVNSTPVAAPQLGPIHPSLRRVVSPPPAVHPLRPTRGPHAVYTRPARSTRGLHAVYTRPTRGLHAAYTRLGARGFALGRGRVGAGAREGREAKLNDTPSRCTRVPSCRRKRLGTSGRSRRRWSSRS